MKGNGMMIWCLIALRVNTQGLKENKKVQVSVEGEVEERERVVFTQFILNIRETEM